MKVSVVIPTYNGSKKIATCLRALQQQSWPEPIEIIVVDDGSKDDSAKVASSFPGVRVVSQANQGPAAARNKGARMATGGILVFTDDDCEPVPDFIKELVSPFERDADLVATKGAYLTKQTRLIARFRQVEYEEKYEKMKRDAHIDFVDTYAAAFRRDRFISAGGFDESLIAAEDVDLSFRLHRGGAKMFFVPKARVYHLHDDSLKAFWKKKTHYAYWRFLAIKKSPGKAIKDSHTPQVAKIQILLVCAMGLAAALNLLPVDEFRTPMPLLTLLGIFFVTTLPFDIFAFRRDALVGVMAPAMLFVRALTGAIGISMALLRPQLRRPAAPAIKA